MRRGALIIWAATTAAHQDCHPHDPSEKADARRIERYITQVYHYHYHYHYHHHYHYHYHYHYYKLIC